MKLQDYIHYYIGCEVIVDGIYRRVLSGGVFVPNEVNQIYYNIEEEDGFNMPYNEDADEPEARVKPILRRLEDMTEEEMIELFQSMVPDDMEDKPTDDEFKLNMFRGDGGNLVDEIVAIGAEISCRCFEGQLTIKKCGTICAYDEAGDEQELVNAPRAYHYLLRQHFDLFGLIDAGLAIDSKTLK